MAISIFFIMDVASCSLNNSKQLGIILCQLHELPLCMTSYIFLVHEEIIL